ncbi:putative nacht and wd40 domain protein [Rosellinia necatrix]|uniref:Putative nacht and wd40 domain protein n=1 Tax=Rosellinia necatrix TaxID=77044 RepID=A0A1W2TTK2_ROSNE|nr:putative nacht and wd40 domain protein [Rosellinia necatrix]
MVLRKKDVYTIITPIPGFIPRQLAIDILHSHGEVITLNPLVLSHKQIKAPRDAAADEYFSTWYEITERVQFVPGMGRFGSGKISFNACFHDLPWGLQTHVYAPLNIDMRNKYRIAGNQPGVEHPEPPEIGLAELGVPKDGLYLREDIEIRCNIAMVGTVKAQMKAASKEMVDRIIKKAELLDAGILRAMIEDGRMKTYKPQSVVYAGGLNEQSRSPQLSPPLPYSQESPRSPRSPTVPYQVPRPVSVQYQQPNRPGTSGSSVAYPSHWQMQQQQMAIEENRPTHLYPGPPYSQPGPPQGGGHSVVMELPGDFYHPQPSPQPSPTNTNSTMGRSSPNPAVPSYSPELNGQRWSHQPNQSTRLVSRPASFASDPGVANRVSPGLEHKGFAAELATHRETPEEHGGGGGGAEKQPWGRAPTYRPYGYSYNPADYSARGR